MFRQLRLTLLTGLLVIAFRGAVHAGQGCCSMHGGITGCDQETNKLQCADGSLSPSCSCDRLRTATSNPPLASKPHAELGKDILIGYPATVRLENLHPKMKATFDSIRDVWGDQKLPKPVITSANDRKHEGSRRPGTRCGEQDSEVQCRATSDSFHYKDRAIDLRSHGMTDQQKDATVLELRRKLGRKYSVAIHSRGKDNEHIHVAYFGD